MNEFLAGLSAIQLISLTIAVVICAYSLLGWANIICGDTKRTAAEEAELEKQRKAYFKRYKVNPPRTWKP